ncbi:MAG: helix-turn-helix domain-containing protein [Lachnospiraceae bacterium]|nr:helix-turn-helix domain-containing protein [Lachnospiraceae bacterium]
MINMPDFIKNVKGLRLFDRFLLAQIYYLSAKKGYCFAKNDYFAELFDVSLGTVKRSLKKMEDMGLIARVKTWTARYIYVTCAPKKEEEKMEEKKVPEEKKNVVKYSREGFKYWQKIMTQPVSMPTKYHVAPKDEGWTDEGLEAADACFTRWKKKISGET